MAPACWSAGATRHAAGFDLVTGVSSGALIAPFAFLGREHDGQLREIFTKYGRQDIFTYNVSGLLEGSALADDAPLARLIEKYVDDAFMQEIARERIKGRILLIGTTNLDTQRPVLWDMGRIAMSHNRDAKSLFRKILLASATLPGVFPPVRIQVRVGGQNYDELHVDGGVTRQVFIAPSIFSFVSHDQKSARPTAKPRLFVIRNGKIDPEWQSVNENVLSVTQRSISTLIKNQGIGDLYRIYSVTRRDGIDFNLASIPADFSDTSDEPFDQKYMVALFDRGYDLASHNYSWVKAPPGMELATQAHNSTDKGPARPRCRLCLSDKRPEQGNHSHGHQPGAEPTQNDQPGAGLESPHQSRICDDHHHHRHDRDRDNTVEHGAPHQHVNGVYSGKAKSESDDGCRRDDRVESDRVRGLASSVACHPNASATP